VKLAGTALLPGSREEVWKLLTDPERLVKILPGAERLEPDGPDRYKVSVKFGIAAITGKYAGAVQLTDQKPPDSLRMRVEGKGLPGFMKGDGQIQLRQKGEQTEVRYSGEAQVGGLIASVGQRMIEGAAKKIVQQFFDAAAAQLRKPGAS
jgi:carbon monoxide dehydrogenase subunit G